MAEAYHVAVAPHNYNSTTIGLAATIHAAAVMPNFLITEYFVNFEALGQEIATPPFVVENGYIALPTAPGLGLDLNEDALARHTPIGSSRRGASATPPTKAPSPAPLPSHRPEQPRGAAPRARYNPGIQRGPILVDRLPYSAVTYHE